MIANLMARLLYAVKVIPTPNLVMGKSDDFLGLYVGHTGTKTRDLITSALGGVLFIDEAYHLLQDSFGINSIILFLIFLLFFERKKLFLNDSVRSS